MEGVSLSGSAAAIPHAARGPAHDVVILRESELGDDLAREIERVRADARTARSQILIIAPTPKSEGAAAEAAPLLAPLALKARHDAAARSAARVGQEIAPLLEDLDGFLGEFAKELVELADDVGEGTRARLQHHARVLGEILAWVRAVGQDLSAVVEAAVQRRRAIDLAELVADTLHDLGGEPGAAPFLVTPSGPACTVEVDEAAAADLVAGAARLVAARSSGRGPVLAEVEQAADEVLVRLAGRGAPVAVQAPVLVARVLELADQLGVALRPGTQGTEAAVLVLAFPRPRR